MNNIDDIVYLKHILDAISRIGEYTKGVNSKRFKVKIHLFSSILRFSLCIKYNFLLFKAQIYTDLRRFILV